jgi:hypothetical protein
MHEPPGKLITLGLLAFWTGLGLAARSYPSAYDWRYLTISSLLYQDRNPEGYFWGSAEFVSCGVCGLYWVLKGVRGHGLTTAALAAGYGCMASCALLPSRPDRPVHVPRHSLACDARFASAQPRPLPIAQRFIADALGERTGSWRLDELVP